MSDNAREMVLEYASQGSRLRDAFFEANHELVVEVGMVMAVSLAEGGKILYCGNGGSAADAQHLAGELVNRFLMERPPLPAVALTTDTSILTAIGNDYGFDQVFQKQVEALGNPGDVLMAISTSGNSANVVKAIEAARERGLVVVAVTANDGGQMAALCDYHINVPSDNTPLAQEVHAAVGHLLVRLVDYYLFEEVGELTKRMMARGGEDVDEPE